MTTLSYAETPCLDLCCCVTGLDSRAHSRIRRTRLPLRRLRIKRDIQPQALPRSVRRNPTVRIGLRNELLATSINQQTDEIRTHVVAREVCQRLGQVALVEIDLRCVSELVGAA